MRRLASENLKNYFKHTWTVEIIAPVCFSIVLTLCSGMVLGQNSPVDDALRVEKIGSSEKSFYVVSTLIIGSTESILFDAQFKVSDGKRVADRIASTNTKLKALVLSHADHDHYMGAMEVIKRFPGTPVYMSQAGLEDFEKRSQSDLDYEKELGKGVDPEVPDVLVEPKLLPKDTLLVDDQEIVIIKGLVGDVRGPASIALWIPSRQTVLTGDLVFQGMHAWLGNADIESRAAWRCSLRQIASLQPKEVIPGHKRDIATADSPDQINFMIQYLEDYDAFMTAAATPDDIIREMKAKYPDLALAFLMAYGAKTTFKK